MSSSRRPRIAWRENPASRLSDLASETFLTREPGSGTRGLMEQLFETAGIRPKIGMAMSSNETIKQAVIAGLESRSFPRTRLQPNSMNGDW